MGYMAMSQEQFDKEVSSEQWENIDLHEEYEKANTKTYEKLVYGDIFEVMIGKKEKENDNV
jgi:predicted ribosome quality control (RQC) complex YloA/Tae2 family protein